MRDITPRLGLAIEGLYRVFERYRIETLVGCPCCTSEEHGRYLVSRPLRSLSAVDLSRYSFKAMSTWGTVDDYKHFLPRIFEDVALNGSPEWPDLEVIYSKPMYGDWLSWPEAEQLAVNEYFRAVWLDVLAFYPHPLDTDSVLCGIALSVDDLRFYLDAWSADEAKPALFHFTDFVSSGRWWPKVRRGIATIDAPWWDERPLLLRQVIDWMIAPERMDALERAFYRYFDEDPESRLSEAFNSLGQLRTALMHADLPAPPS